MDTLRVQVHEQQDAEGKFIIVVLQGTPITIRVTDSRKYSSALRDARHIAIQVHQGDMHWSEGIGRLALRTEYYGQPLPALRQTVSMTVSTSWPTFVMYPCISLKKACLKISMAVLGMSSLIHKRRPLAVTHH